MSAPTAENRVRRWSIHLRLWKLHRWLALGFGAVLVIVSVSGGLLVMHPEIERVLERDRHVIVLPSEPAARAPIGAIVRHAATLAPAGFRPLRVEPGKAVDRTDKYVFISDDGANRRWSAYANPYTGNLVWHGPDQSLFRPWLLHLHEYLHIGKIGYVIVGLASVALTLLGITGIWITRDRIRVLLRQPFRLHLGRRVAFADIHKWIGLCSLYFTFVLGATGIWFSWHTVTNVLTAKPLKPLAPAFDTATLTPIEPALAVVRSTFPDAELARIIFPWDTGVGLQIRVLHRSAPPWRKMSRIDFDPVSGDVRRIRDAAQAPASTQFESILSPLHFGYFGSPLVKWLYVVGGFSPALLAITGTAVWLSRRSRKSPA